MARYTNPRPQIIDRDNKIIVGAKKFLFEVGTTTKKTVYSDSDLTVAQANPVLSDSVGRFPDIFLNGVYKEEQQDNSGTPTGYDGATLWTSDPVGGSITGPFLLWQSDVIYNIPDIVLASNDEYYRSLTDTNTGNDPTLAIADWEQLTFGRLYNANITYSKGDSAYGSDGFLYISRTNNNLNNNPVTNTVDWRPGTRLQFTKGPDIQSLAALPVGPDGSYFDIIGTNTITSINSLGVGYIVKLHFNASLTLTHNATSLILPGSKNIQTAAGDEAEFIEDSIGNWRCTKYSKSSGLPVIDKASNAGAGLIYLGNGFDGAKTVAGAENIAPGEYHYTSFTINTGQTLTLNAAGALIIRVTGAATIIGTIDASGRGAAGAPSAVNAAGATGSSGAGGASAASGGGDGAVNGGGVGGASIIHQQTLPGGIASTSGQGGFNGNGVSQLMRNVIEANTGMDVFLLAGGGGGGGGSESGTATGGAGGDGGGAVIIIAKTIDFQGAATINCSGNNGGTGFGGADGSGGGGGGGGGVAVLAGESVVSLGNLNMTGGTGGGGNNGGNAGATGGAGYPLTVTVG